MCVCVCVMCDWAGLGLARYWKEVYVCVSGGRMDVLRVLGWFGY